MNLYPLSICIWNSDRTLDPVATIKQTDVEVNRVFCIQVFLKCIKNAFICFDFSVFLS